MYDGKTHFEIDSCCANFNDFEILTELIMKQHLKTNELEPCIQCLKALINFALMLLDDETILDKAIAKILTRMGKLLFRHKKFDDAIELHELALSFKMVYSSQVENLDIALSYRCVGEAYASKDMLQQALNNFREALKGVDNDEKVLVLDKMGVILCEMKKFEEAIDVYKMALW